MQNGWKEQFGNVPSISGSFSKCETKSKKGDGLLAFLKMFSKFSNLKSMSAFEKVKYLAQNGLGHLQDKIRETAVGFFTAAYKELRAHKVKYFNFWW